MAFGLVGDIRRATPWQNWGASLVTLVTTVTRSGKPLFAVVPYEDAELLEALEDRMDLDLAKKALKRNDTVSWAKAKKELGL